MKKLVLLGMALSMLLFLAACGGSPAENTAPTAEATESAPTDIPASPAPTETAVPAAAGTLADTFPCDATMVTDQGNLLRVIHRVPDSTSPVVGARRAGQALTITEVQTDAAGVVWYNVSENNRTVGWLEPQYVVVSADCVSGSGNAEAEATAE